MGSKSANGPLAATPASVLAFSLLLALQACREERAPETPAITSVGTSVARMTGDGDLWLIEVSEQAEGDRDLNGDGDAWDAVPFVYDVATGTLRALPVQMGSRAFPFHDRVVRGRLAAFYATESGGPDLNGDGDTDDYVLHVYDRTTGTTTNTALASLGIEPVVEGDLVVFDGYEWDHGQQDLDGDGDAEDVVLFVYDAARGTTLNTHLRLSAVLGVEVTLQDGFVAFATDEASGDRNGDGDTLDAWIPEVFDVATGTTLDFAYATRQADAPQRAGEAWVFLVDEAGQGAMDLNGDGDSEDGVLHALEPAMGVVRNLGVSAVHLPPRLERDGRLVLLRDEIDGVDRNGDGDREDAFVVFYDCATGSVIDTGLAFDANGPPLAFFGHELVLAVSEADQGIDLDGDGDRADHVIHLVDPATGAAMNLGVAGSAWPQGERLLIARSESDEQRDWNEDGDRSDSVAFVYERATGRLTNTRIAGAAIGATERWVFVESPEGQQHRDWNADGDEVDSAYVLFDRIGERPLPLGLTRGPDALARMDVLGRALFAVRELNRDLNGDGDVADEVLHRFR